MLNQLFKFPPSDSPKACQQEYQSILEVVPNGAGLQILYKINADENKYYLLVGPRFSRKQEIDDGIITVNGGNIPPENSDKPFIEQLIEEMKEETFHIIQLAKDGGNIIININDIEQKSYPLIWSEDAFLYQSDKSDKSAQYAYITFTAICEGLNLEQLKTLARTLSPIANFWNKIGNYLRLHITNIKNQSETFSHYWSSQQQEREKFIAELLKEFEKLIKLENLLESLKDVFESENMKKSLDTLNEIHNIDELKKINSKVSRYSERLGYYIVDADNLLNTSQKNETKIEIYDINLQPVTKNGLLNKAAFTETFSALKASYQMNKKTEPVLISASRFTLHTTSTGPSSLESTKKFVNH